jgi:hypothetical protein
VTSADPGASAVPMARNQSGPLWTISAIAASVSTFWTRVGRRRTPRWSGLGGTNSGRPPVPFSRLTSAVSWLAT